MTTETVTWEGAEALRPFLVSVDALEPFPGNPRLGDVQRVVDSLRRFGQPRPILVDANDGRRIVAGHHVRLAAIELGWTHVAAIEHEFKDEEEARAYLLADNRTHDLGLGYDTGLLIEQLRVLADGDALEGTGYSLDDLDRYVAELNKPPPAVPPMLDPPPDTEIEEILLMYPKGQVKQLNAWLAIVEKECGTNGISETVYAAVELAARELNA